MSLRSRVKSERIKALLHTAAESRSASQDDAPIDPDQLRRLLADFCKLIGARMGKVSVLNGAPHAPALPVIQEVTPPMPSAPEVILPPRLRQTLARLLTGDSEKQIAAHLRLSPHTVHAYVKSLHKRFRVSSRGELLARFITPSIIPSKAM